MDQHQKIIGIDLGTTNSALAVIRNGVPALLPVDGAPLLPSVVGRTPEGELLVGTPARNQWAAAPERTVRSIKRRMGSTEPVAMAGDSYTPQEVSAFILRKLKAAAEEALGGDVERAVVTVPAYFNEVQRQATVEAGRIAGLTVERIINEPTAAALAYGYGRSDADADGFGDEEALRVLVYDLGGGTFDVSVIELSHGVVDVLATAGDNHLGGDDFDERLAAWLAEGFARQHDLDLRAEHRAWARLLRAAEEAKIELSAAPFAAVSLEYLAEAEGGTPLHLRREVERQRFETLIDDFLGDTLDGIDQAPEDAGLQAQDLDRVLLVGGSTRIPAVYERVAERLGQEPHSEINPDEAVALGAAVQAGIVAGEEVDAVLVDVTPLSLGIEMAQVSWRGRLSDDHFKALIRRNTTIPVQKSELFTTLYPGQEAIEVKVYQGEAAVASQNTLLGEFRVEDLESNRPDELAEVTVHFALDVNGLLSVTVTDRATGKQVREHIQASRQRLSPEDIARSQPRLLDEEPSGDGQAAGDVAEGPPLDPATAALLDRAHRVLERPDLDPSLTDNIEQQIDVLRRALAEGDEDRADAQSDALIDLLMEAEGE